jgi:2-keto-4-pentenoate hydratase
MTTDTVSTAHIDRAAEQLRLAAETATPCPPVRALIGSTAVGPAYAVQRQLVEQRLATGGSIVGRKIGLTSPAVQAQLGVDQPDFGVLFADMEVADGGTVSAGRLLQPKIEAEIAFFLAEDLTDGPLGLDQVRAAVDHARAALEIVDSRIAGWDISFADTVADNASSGLFVLGTSRRTLDEVEPRTVDMVLRRGEEVVSTGSGSACLGDPLLALAWLARTSRRHGDPLLAGQVVLSGALGPMVTVVPGDVFTTQISGFDPVSISFADTAVTEGVQA